MAKNNPPQLFELANRRWKGDHKDRGDIFSSDAQVLRDAMIGIVNDLESCERLIKVIRDTHQLIHEAESMEQRKLPSGDSLASTAWMINAQIPQEIAREIIDNATESLWDMNHLLGERLKLIATCAESMKSLVGMASDADPTFPLSHGRGGDR